VKCERRLNRPATGVEVRIASEADVKRCALGFVSAPWRAKHHRVEHINEGSTTPFSHWLTPGTWARTSPAKLRVFLPAVAGFAIYTQVCNEVVAGNYRGFDIA
jgi:hypothetical protein